MKPTRSDIRSSKAPSGISGSRSTTLSASQSRSNSDGTSRPCHLAGPQLPGRLCPELPHSRSLPTARAFKSDHQVGASQGNGKDPRPSLVLCAEIERDSSSQSDAVRRTRLQTFDFRWRG